MKNELENAIADFKGKQRDLVKLVQTKFGEAANEIFDKHPKLESFGWKQYTDYFNDGDTCYFSAHVDMDALTLNGERAQDLDGLYETKYKRQPDGNYKDVPNENYDPDLSKAGQAAEKFLYGIGDDMLEQVFGDHKEVTVTRDGVTTEDYTDHD